MRKWLRQGDKRNCGQIALAVITGHSLKSIENLLGHSHGSKTRELAKVLRFFGYDCPDRLQRLKERPKLAIAKLSRPNTSKWHWVVIDGDKIYDGVNGTKSGTVKWKEGRRITSYLPIKKRK